MITKTPILWILCGCIALFWILSFTVDHIVLGRIVNALRLGMSVVVVVVFTPSLWAELRSPQPSAARLALFFGIVFSWAGNALFGAIRLGSQLLSGTHSVPIQTRLTSFVVFLILLAALSHLLAPMLVTNFWPARRLKWLYGIGLTLGAVLITLSVYTTIVPNI